MNTISVVADPIYVSWFSSRVSKPSVRVFAFSLPSPFAHPSPRDDTPIILTALHYTEK